MKLPCPRGLFLRAARIASRFASLRRERDSKAKRLQLVQQDEMTATEEYTIPEWANGDIFWELEPRQRESIFTDDEDDELLSDRQARLLDNMLLSDLAKTPGCSKCRYSSRGCKACVPSKKRRKRARQ